MKDIYQKYGKVLRQTVHTMAVQNALLQHENLGLIEALINEKKRQQRGKPLLLEAPYEYHGDAVFWSLSKVKDARHRQDEKEATGQAENNEKDEKKRLQAEAKAEKARVMEERAQMRQVMKEIKLQEQRTKDSAKEEARLAREAAAQHKKDLQSAKNGKASDSIQRRASLAMVVGSDNDIDQGIDESRDDISTPTAARSRRKKPTKLPKRFIVWSTSILQKIICIAIILTSIIPI